MEKHKQYDVIVIGGGAAGLCAAGVAAARGKHVLLLEKNPILGKKLSITGGGRCNITNDTRDVHTFLDTFADAKKFLYSPFAQFSVDDTFAFFEKTLNLPLTTQARNRVFPASEKASDVVRVLVEYAKKHDVDIRCGTSVTGIVATKNMITSVSCGTEHHYAKKFILSTGGLAAPETGSTGDGFRFLKTLGHTIKKPNPTIVPLTTDASWVHNLSGTSLSFMHISFQQGGKARIKKRGKILFTHFGISGPLILNTAFEVKKLLTKGAVTASIDLFPDTEDHLLDKRIWRLFEKHKNKTLKNVLVEMLPKALCTEILHFDNLSIGDKAIHDITKEERKLLTHTLKHLSFPITGTLGFDKAVIADGGVIPEEIDFSTMTSRLYPNLYLIGDTISINRPSGGYSLQLCWTTAHVAAMDC